MHNDNNTTRARERPRAVQGQRVVDGFEPLVTRYGFDFLRFFAGLVGRARRTSPARFGRRSGAVFVVVCRFLFFFIFLSILSLILYTRLSVANP